jgi:photosystem II stability/assembly factor-like uncharacterized protein
MRLRNKRHVFALLGSLICLASIASCASTAKDTRPINSANSLETSEIAQQESPRPQVPEDFRHVELLSRESWFVAEPKRVLRTDDGGRTWKQIYDLPSDPNIHISAASFLDGDHCFLVVGMDDTFSRVVYTEDGGKVWNEAGKIALPDEKISFEGCYFADRLNGWAVGLIWSKGYGGNDPKIPAYVGIAFRTEDGGRSWARLSLDLPKNPKLEGARWELNDVYFKDSKTGWIVGDLGAVFWTIDGGETWHLAHTERVDYQSVDSLDGRFGWATYKRGNSPWGVAATVDGGQHWSLLNESFVYGTWPAYAAFIDPQHGFTISLALYETHDQGHKWSKRLGGPNINDSSFDYLGVARDGTLVIFGKQDNNFVPLVSTDHGVSWQPVS